MADRTLIRLSEIALLGVVLWALTRPAPADRYAPAVSAVKVLLGGFAAVAVIGLAADILIAATDGRAAAEGPLLAGPFALLLAAVIFIWPLACLRHVAPKKTAPPTTFRISRWLVPALLPFLYAWLRFSPAVGNTTVVALFFVAVAVVALTLLMLHLIFGPAPPWLAVLGVPAVLLGTTALWPLPYWVVFDFRVNVMAKWLYTAAALAAVAGLCIIAVRTAPRLRWQVASVGAITLAVVPSLLIVIRPWDLHTVGRTPLALFGLYGDLSWLVEWMVLGLLALALSHAPRRPVPKADLRRYAVAAALVVFYSDDRMLYVPTSRLIGFALLMLFLLPAALVEPGSVERSPRDVLRNILSAWRRADVAKQRLDSLGSQPPETLRDQLAEDKISSEEFLYRVARIDQADRRLDDQRRQHAAEARRLKAQAFSHAGAHMDMDAAKLGGRLGAAFGLIPFTVALLGTDDLWSGDYPVLTFAGTTLWWYLYWPAIGWLFGLLLPLIRGKNGVEKGAVLFLTAMAPGVFWQAVWTNGHDWPILLYALTLVFCLGIGVIVGDLRLLHDAGLTWTDWPRVHHWRFVVTWSTALIVAISSAAATYASSFASELGKTGANSVSETGGSSPGGGNVAPPAPPPNTTPPG